MNIYERRLIPYLLHPHIFNGSTLLWWNDSLGWGIIIHESFVGLKLNGSSQGVIRFYRSTLQLLPTITHYRRLLLLLLSFNLVDWWPADYPCFTDLRFTTRFDPTSFCRFSFPTQSLFHTSSICVKEHRGDIASLMQYFPYSFSKSNARSSSR